MAGLNILHPCFLAGRPFYGGFGEMALGVSILSWPAGFFRMYSMGIRLRLYIQGRQAGPGATNNSPKTDSNNNLLGE